MKLVWIGMVGSLLVSLYSVRDDNGTFAVPLTGEISSRKYAIRAEGDLPRRRDEESSCARRLSGAVYTCTVRFSTLGAMCETSDSAWPTLAKREFGTRRLNCKIGRCSCCHPLGVCRCGSMRVEGGQTVCDSAAKRLFVGGHAGIEARAFRNHY